MNPNPILGIIAGEDIDMPSDFIAKNKIQQYEFNITWDGVLQNRNEIYKKMREFKDNKEIGTPRTSQPSIGLFKELFENGLQEYDELLVISISSKLSGCYNGAIQAMEMLEKPKNSRIHVLDSHLTTSGSAFIINELVNGIKQNLSSEEILKKIDNLYNKINVVCMVEDSYWLQKGGRISPAIAMILNQMKKIGVRPLLGIKDGKVVLLNVRTKAKNKAAGMYDYIKNEIGEKKAELIITHADNLSEAEELSSLIKEKMKNIDILYIHQLSPVFGAHVGPGTLVAGWKIL